MSAKEIIKEIKALFSTKQEEPAMDVVEKEVVELSVEAEAVVETEVEAVVETEAEVDTEIKVELETETETVEVELAVGDPIEEEVPVDEAPEDEEELDLKVILDVLKSFKTSIDDILSRVEGMETDLNAQKTTIEEFGKLDVTKIVADTPSIVKTKSSFGNKMIEQIANQRKELGLGDY